MSVMSGGTEAPVGRRRGRGRKNAGGGIGGRAVAGGFGYPQKGIGNQLQRRVQAGAIDQTQAQQTADQRKLLAQAFGPNWRTKVFGDRGYAQRTRTSLAKEPDNPMIAALNKKLNERRKKMLAVAQERVGG